MKTLIAVLVTATAAVFMPLTFAILSVCDPVGRTNRLPSECPGSNFRADPTTTTGHKSTGEADLMGNEVSDTDYWDMRSD